MVHWKDVHTVSGLDEQRKQCVILAMHFHIFSWMSKKQEPITQSPAEAEYSAVGVAAHQGVEDPKSYGVATISGLCDQNIDNQCAISMQKIQCNMREQNTFMLSSMPLEKNSGPRK